MILVILGLKISHNSERLELPKAYSEINGFQLNVATINYFLRNLCILSIYHLLFFVFFMALLDCALIQRQLRTYIDTNYKFNGSKAFHEQFLHLSTYTVKFNFTLSNLSWPLVFVISKQQPDWNRILQFSVWYSEFKKTKIRTISVWFYIGIESLKCSQTTLNIIRQISEISLRGSASSK